jgi:hypothetical protein
MAKAKKNFRGRKRRMRAPDLTTDLFDVLAAIESIVGDEFCEELDCDVLLPNRTPTEFEKSVQGKLSAVYRLAHSFNPRHCCHHVHDVWRKELEKYNQCGQYGPNSTGRAGTGNSVLNGLGEPLR